MVKIIVLTPVKNEDWILEQFLTVVSLFADCIIIADQQSTDNSRAICARFSKVYLIDNDNPEFNEAGRQILLIETARRLFPEDKRIFFCLDADEIFSADSLDYKETWNNIKNLDAGTAIYIEKPDLLYDMERCVRWKSNFFAIGCIDDGSRHLPKAIHSKRIPDSPNGKIVYINDIKILHFAQARRNVQAAKSRYYSVIENINNTKPFYLRRFAYKYSPDENDNFPIENIEVIPQEWLKGWSDKGINLNNLPDPEFSWHSFETLSLFKKYNYRKFYLDDIWDFDWEKCREIAKQDGRETPDEPIVKPGYLLKAWLKIVDSSYLFYRQLCKA